MRSAYKSLVREPEGKKRNFEGPDIEVRLIFK
jgi:hypothetical protein